MASIIQFIENRPSKRFEAHPRTEGLEHKYDVTRDDGVTGVLLMWGGGNAFKASVHMEGFEDRQRNVMRRAARNSKYDVARGEQVELKDGVVAAVLSIRGTPRDGLSPQEYLAAQEQAFSSSSAAGLISEICLQAREGRTVGGCYLFADEPSRDAFAEAWKSGEAASSLDDVVVEKFSVDDANTAASA